MPTYEYACFPCGHHFEELHLSINRIPDMIHCPVCGSLNTRRCLAAPAIQIGTSKHEREAGEPLQQSKRLKDPIFGRKELNELSKSNSSGI